MKIGGNRLAYACGVSLVAMTLSGYAQAADAQADMYDPLFQAAVLAVYGGGVLYDPDNVDTDETNVPVLGVRFSTSLPVARMWSLQFDFSGEAALGIAADNDPPDTDDSTLSEVTGAVHLAYRDPESHLLGVFGGAGQSRDNGDNASGPIPYYFVGLEGQSYFDDVTVAGQFGYLSSSDDYFETVDSGVFGRAAVYRYFGEETKAGIEASILHGSRPNGFGGNGKLTTYGWGASITHQLANMPFAVTGAYNGYYYKTTNESDSPYVNEFRIGLVFQTGGSGLKTQDRRGVASDLPPIGRWISTSANEIE